MTLNHFENNIKRKGIKSDGKGYNPKIEQAVRGIRKSGIKPEEILAEEDIKKLERRVKSLDKQIAKKKLKGKNRI
jgi:DNA-damage-inducible protein D